MVATLRNRTWKWISEQMLKFASVVLITLAWNRQWWEGEMQKRFPNLRGCTYSKYLPDSMRFPLNWSPTPWFPHLLKWLRTESKWKLSYGSKVSVSNANDICQKMKESIVLRGKSQKKYTVSFTFYLFTYLQNKSFLLYPSKDIDSSLSMCEVKESELSVVVLSRGNQAQIGTRKPRIWWISISISIYLSKLNTK